jgi:hypothetical protein
MYEYPRIHSFHSVLQVRSLSICFTEFSATLEFTAYTYTVIHSLFGQGGFNHLYFGMPL